ncbi:MAG: DUF6790 family protein [Devosia sp.]
MYFAMILLLMFVVPAASVLVEMLAWHPEASWIALIGKWFVFWGVGVRLAIAGIVQVFAPAFTAGALDIKDSKAQVLVRELGFGNLAIGATGVLSLLLPVWTLAAAMCGGLFYGFAGTQHVFTTKRTAKENWALASDLFLFAVMAVYVGASLLER